MHLLKRYRFILIVSIIAFFIRIYNISQLPPSLSWDEVSIGYNAYSILTTGKDEHGKFMPMVAFAGYGDYKPPVSIYLTVPFIWLFGLNEFGVRLPVVIISSFAIPLIFFISLQFFKDNKEKYIAYISALLLTISPWHIQLSRGAFEATIALSFLLLGFWLILKSRYSYKVRIFMFIPFVVSMYTFNSSRYIAPLLICMFLVYYYKTFKFKFWYTLTGIFLALFLTLPLIPHILSQEGQLRFHEVNIFTNPQIVINSNAQIEEMDNVWWSKILFNRRFKFVREYLIHYFDNFEPNFLFITGDGNAKFSSHDVGQLYIFEFIFIFVGTLSIFKRDKNVGILLITWLFISIIPAGVARETPHALRILNALPIYIILISIGIIALVNKLNMSYLHIFNTKIIFILLLCSMYSLYLCVFGYNYFVHYPREYAGDWQWGYKQAIVYANSQKYPHIVLSESIGRAYMYVLFYSKTDLNTYLNSVDGGFDAAGFYNVQSFDKWSFAKNFELSKSSDTLYIFPPSDVPANAVVLKDFTRADNTIVLQAFTL